jgi:hypothetical protein
MSDYEIRKQFLEDLKMLNKSEQEEVFRILKMNDGIYSENSNGIFFDVQKLSDELFQKMVKFIEFCKNNRKEFENREEEEKKAQDIINSYDDEETA